MPFGARMLLAISMMLIAACTRAHSIDFGGLASADLILVEDLSPTSDKELRPIEDPGQIRFVVEFLEHHKDGWTEPFGGQPVPLLMLDFTRVVAVWAALELIQNN